MDCHYIRTEGLIFFFFFLLFIPFVSYLHSAHLGWYVSIIVIKVIVIVLIIMTTTMTEMTTTTKMMGWTHIPNQDLKCSCSLEGSCFQAPCEVHYKFSNFQAFKIHENNDWGVKICKDRQWSLYLPSLISYLHMNSRRGLGRPSSLGECPPSPPCN